MPPFRNRLRTPEFSRRKRRVFYIKLALLILLAAGFIGGLAYGANRDALRIKTIVIEGGDLVDEEALVALMRERISGKYLFLFPRDNSFIYSRQTLKAAALESFKRLETVEVNTQGFQTVVISVSERSPDALWCGENRPWGEITMSCYFMDAQGYIYTEAPAFTGDVYVRFFGPLISGNPVGQSYLPASRFHEFKAFFERLKEKGVPVAEFALVGDEEYELYLEDGTRILFDDDQSLLRIFDNLLSTLSSEELSGRERLNLEYIDLRFGNKVYFKER